MFMKTAEKKEISHLVPCLGVWFEEMVEDDTAMNDKFYHIFQCQVDVGSKVCV